MKENENEIEKTENIKKEEMELDEDGLSKKWKLFNVLMVGFAFMLIFTGRGLLAAMLLVLFNHPFSANIAATDEKPKVFGDVKR